MILRPFQKEALALLATPHPCHVLCIAPTGSGKSLIYEQAALRPNRRTLLVTPLVALARQQQRKLVSCGVPAVLGAGGEKGRPIGNQSGAWILSPESLHHSSTERTLSAWKPNFLVVDECHCLWDWGERFRPAFLDIPKLIDQYAIPQSLWLTATLPFPAQMALQKDISVPLSKIGSFELPKRLKLRIERTPWPDRSAALLDTVRERGNRGLIFVATRNDTDRLARLITAGTGQPAIGYHGGLSSEERRNIEAGIGREKRQVVVATSAFGMGMDYPHLEYAIVWQSPPSLLSLVQTIGRVGRNQSRTSDAIVFWDDDDFFLLEWTLKGSERARVDLLKLREFYLSMECRSSWLTRYFDGNYPDKHCQRCDACDLISLQYPDVTKNRL